MYMQIRNWKLTVLTILLMGLFISLGCWQLSRANQKQRLLASFAQRTQQAPLSIHHLDEKKDLRFYRLHTSGHFDNQHTFLLDNKIWHGQVGYEIYTPFYSDGFPMPILVDRGFIPASTVRTILPAIRNIPGASTISGLLNLPPAYVALGQIRESAQLNWPLRIEYISLAELSKLTGSSFFPYILTLTPEDPAAYSIEWQIVTMPPERHRGYAAQWFAFALTLLILFVALNRRKSKSSVIK